MKVRLIFPGLGTVIAIAMVLDNIRGMHQYCAIAAAVELLATIEVFDEQVAIDTEANLRWQSKKRSGWKAFHCVRAFCNGGQFSAIVRLLDLLGCGCLFAMANRW